MVISAVRKLGVNTVPRTVIVTEEIPEGFSSVFTVFAFQALRASCNNGTEMISE